VIKSENKPQHKVATLPSNPLRPPTYGYDL